MIIITKEALRAKKKRTYNIVADIKNLEKFKKLSDIIIANRVTDEIKDVMSKVYTRDLFKTD